MISEITELLSKSCDLISVRLGSGSQLLFHGAWKSQRVPSHEVPRNPTAIDASSSDFSSSIDEKDDESVKATITWPIIKGGENVSSIKKSSFNKQRAQLIFKDTKNKILTETSNYWSKYQSSKSVLEATKAQLNAAEIANEGISAEYNSGAGRTTLEVIQSNSLLLNAQISLADSERNFILSKFNLLKSVGLLHSEYLKIN